MSAQPNEQICMLQLEGMTLSSRFVVQYRLRCGSYSELFLARNLLPRRDEPESVVIKALNVRLRGEPATDLERTLIECFEREGRALKQCPHQNIVRLFDCGAGIDHAGQPLYFLALEYLPGGNLRDLLQTGRMNLTKALSLLGQISAALRCIHQHGLVHRDVKPANIMLSQSHDVAKLIDLGTIRGLDDASQLTEIGTPLYAAPEQYLPSRTQGARLTAATDVYALAKTAYAMLTGAEPRGFNQRQIVSLPREVANEAWAMPVLRVFMKATSDDPATRHRSVAEFYADLCDAIEVTSYTVRETVAPRGNFRFVVKLARPAATPSRAMRISAWLAFAFARLRLVIANLYHRCRRRESDAVRIAPRGWYRGAAAIVLLCLLTLAFVPGILHFSRRMLTPPAVEAEQNQEAPDERLQATTDINIRERPNPKARRVGLVARDSIVRLLKRNQSQKWCQIEVVTHGRPKTDPTFLDRGWVSCRYLAGVSAISMNPDLT